MDAEQGVEAVELFDADAPIPIHYDAFRSSLSEFREAIARAGLEDPVAYVERGDIYHSAVPAVRRET